MPTPYGHFLLCAQFVQDAFQQQGDLADHTQKQILEDLREAGWIESLGPSFICFFFYSQPSFVKNQYWSMRANTCRSTMLSFG